jgi:hypothetical protein
MYKENDKEEVSYKSLHAVYKENGGDLSKIALGRYIQSFFPKAKVYNKWFPSGKKRISVYKGLGARLPNSEAESSEFASL